MLESGRTAKQSNEKSQGDVSMKRFLAAILVSLAAASANAQHDIGAGVLVIDADSHKITSMALTYDFKANDNFAYQVGVAFGGDDTLSVPSFGDIKIELDYAIYGKGKLGITTGPAFWFLSAGYATVNMKASTMGFSIKNDGNGAMLGAGVDLFAWDRFGLGLEYSRSYGDLKDTDLLQAVIKYRF
jgi:hypothetical protein